MAGSSNHHASTSSSSSSMTSTSSRPSEYASAEQSVSSYNRNMRDHTRRQLEMALNSTSSVGRTLRTEGSVDSVENQS
ncbi:MAG: hypothetical protein M1823_002657 [Watsoniomyces obsoletus]|nr:MAG: hypothetical protein M1823_002657 [Watsoniomyces obsoletus]